MRNKIDDRLLTFIWDELSLAHTHLTFIYNLIDYTKKLRSKKNILTNYEEYIYLVIVNHLNFIILSLSKIFDKRRDVKKIDLLLDGIVDLQVKQSLQNEINELRDLFENSELKNSRDEVIAHFERNRGAHFELPRLDQLEKIGEIISKTAYFLEDKIYKEILGEDIQLELIIFNVMKDFKRLINDIEKINKLQD